MGGPINVNVIIETRRIRFKKENGSSWYGPAWSQEDTDWVGRNRIGLRRGSGTQEMR